MAGPNFVQPRRVLVTKPWVCEPREAKSSIFFTLMTLNSIVGGGRRPAPHWTLYTPWFTEYRSSRSILCVIVAIVCEPSDQTERRHHIELVQFSLASQQVSQFPILLTNKDVWKWLLDLQARWLQGTANRAGYPGKDSWLHSFIPLILTRYIYHVLKI